MDDAKKFRVQLDVINEDGTRQTSARECVDGEEYVNFYEQAGMLVGYSLLAFDDVTTYADVARFVSGFLRSFDIRDDHEELKEIISGVSYEINKWIKADDERVLKNIEDISKAALQNERSSNQ